MFSSVEVENIFVFVLAKSGPKVIKKVHAQSS